MVCWSLQDRCSVDYAASQYHQNHSLIQRNGSCFSQQKWKGYRRNKNTSQRAGQQSKNQIRSVMWRQFWKRTCRHQWFKSSLLCSQTITLAYVIMFYSYGLLTVTQNRPLHINRIQIKSAVTILGFNLVSGQMSLYE